MDQEAPAPVSADIEKRVGQYVKVRDALKALDERHRAERQPLTQLLDKLGGRLQKFLGDNSLENVKTKAGSCYVSTRYTASVQDADAFMRFVIEGKHFDLLERRASSEAVKDYVKTHNHLPAGVNLNAMQSVGVRRPTGKKDD